MLLAAYQGLVFGIFAYLVVRLRAPRRMYPYVTVPIIMVFSEACVPFVFPWFLGNGVTPQIVLAQGMEPLGVRFFGALIVAVNAALAQAYLTGRRTRRPPLRDLAIAGTILGLLAGFGTWRLSMIDAATKKASTIRVAMVEANIGMFLKNARNHDMRDQIRILRRNILEHQRLTVEAVQKGAELVVWPETSYQPGSYGLGVKRTEFFGLVRTYPENRLLLQLADNNFLDPTTIPVGHPLYTATEKLRKARIQGKVTAVVGGREDSALVLTRKGDILRLDTDGEWHPELSKVAAKLNDGWVGTSEQPRDFLRAKVLDCEDEDPGCDLPAVVVGNAGVYLRRTSKGWIPSDPIENRPDLLAIDGLRSDDIFAVGRDGHIIWDTGTRARPADPPETVYSQGPTLRGVATSEAGYVVAVGDKCTVVIGSGRPGRARTFRSQQVPNCTEQLRAVLFRRPYEFIAVGRKGTVLYGTMHSRNATPIKISRYQLDDTSDIWDLNIDPYGRIAAHLANGRILDLFSPALGPVYPQRSQPEKEVSTTASERETEGVMVEEIGRVPSNIRRMAFIGFLRDWPIPDDATYVYKSRRPLPDAANAEQMAHLDAVHRTPLMDREAIIRGFDANLLFGAISYPGKEVLERGLDADNRHKNSVFLTAPNGAVKGVSHKIKLLIFGEYIPFVDVFPSLRKLIPEGGHFIPGDRLYPLDFTSRAGRKVRIAPLICYEDIIPRFSHEAIALSPNLLVNVTNDAWFGKTSEPALHLQLAVARAIETRRPLIRSTNTGISAFVDPAGRFLQRSSLEHEEVLVEDIPMGAITSWHGLPAKLLFWLAVAWIGLLLLGDMVMRASQRQKDKS
ncbi:MAG: apolipoprotein N-acyltransferase [Myxococcales bacterium]|nr:apolipoprotein N-acyltransferase [Myxococcales bacterium]